MILTPIDWVMVGVLVISMVISFFRGFVREALSLGTWVAAAIIARLFAENVSTLLVPYIELASLRLGAAYLLLVAGTLIVGALVNNLVTAFVQMTGLAGTDRFFGMFFGLARGGVVIVLVVAGLYYLTPFPEDPWWQQSVLLPHVIAAVEFLGPVLWDRGGEFVNTLNQGKT